MLSVQYMMQTFMRGMGDSKYWDVARYLIVLHRIWLLQIQYVRVLAETIIDTAREAFRSRLDCL